jgi:hypothetical protein
MPLRLVPKAFDAIDVISFVCKEFGMVDTEVLEVRNIQHVIPSPAIRIDDAIRYYLTLNDGQ